VLDSELAGITEIDMGQFGFYETEEEELERKKKDFEERMASGELSDDSEEYQEFLAKFEAKKTTATYEICSDVSNEIRALDLLVANGVISSY
jgi:hypothetical protein